MFLSNTTVLCNKLLCLTETYILCDYDDAYDEDDDE